MVLNSSLCDYIDTYILVKGTIAITSAGAQAVAKRADTRNMHVTFKNCGPFTNYIIQIIITQVDNVEYLGILILMYDLLEYNNNYSKTSRSLWQYYKNTLNNNIVSSESFKFEVRIT